MECIGLNQYMLIIATFVTIMFAYQCKAQSPSSRLDSLLQDYAYRAFVHPHTGVIYDASTPSNLTGIKISVIRLKSGSLLTRGANYKEFHIPRGVIIQPYSVRLALVYHNLGNWSFVYYPLPGFTYLTPVIGFLAYVATNLSATKLNGLDVVASKSPISIKFEVVKPVPSGLTAKCVWFDLDGTPEFRDLVSEDVCSTYRQGHFSIVVNSTGLAPSPSPSPSPSLSGKIHLKSREWKIVVGCVGGFIGLVLLALLLDCIRRYRKNKKLAEMEQRAEMGESLHMARVGATQAPVALGTRTPPVLENEYVA